MANNTNATVYIPDNFSEGTAVFGVTIKVKWAVQGVPCIALFVFLILTAGAALSLKVKITLIAVTCIPVLILAISGINGESLFSFAGHWISYRRRRRIALYNPRIKSEARSEMQDYEQRQELPREKIQGFIAKRKYKTTGSKVNVNSIDMENIVFADDTAFTDKKTGK